jgi:adenine-specific DNA-methyltransferase
MNLQKKRLKKLKKLFPEVFTEGLQIDWDKLRLTLGQNIDLNKERYGLHWPGKADCFKHILRGSQATLAPYAEESLKKDGTPYAIGLEFGESNDSENIFIEGENLEVLKLLQKSYLGKIKLIYIDPPYNTGKDFIYPDSFKDNLANYLQYTGQAGENGKKWRLNPETDGRYHSHWLNMMYPRLFLARNLLREDGVIFISIDDNELDNLRKICDEIFGEQNRLDRGCLIWLNQGSTKGFTQIVKNHEYILAYGKNADCVKTYCPKTELLKSKEIDERLHILRSPKNPVAAITFPKGLRIEKELNKVFRGSIGKGQNRIDIRSEKMEFRNGVLVEDTILEAAWPSKNQLLSFLRGETTYDTQGQRWIAVYFNPNGVPYHKKERNRRTPSSVIKDVGNTGFNDLEKIKLSRFFPYAKPVALIKELLKFFTSYEEPCLILDFFAGSATTAHAVIELNKEDGGERRFICVQIPEPTDPKSEAAKAGYKTIAEIGKERIRRAAAKIQQEITAQKEKEDTSLLPRQEEKNIDLGFRVFKLVPSCLKPWNSAPTKDPSLLERKLFEHIDPIAPPNEKTRLLYEILLKSGFPLAAHLQKLYFDANAQKLIARPIDRAKVVYSVAEGALLICLEEEVDIQILRAMAEAQPARIICLDKSFRGKNADALKTNAVMLMQSKGVISFRTI